MRRRRLLQTIAAGTGAGAGTLTMTQEVEGQADSRPGTEQWRFETRAGDFVSSSPTVADGTVYVGSADGNLYAVDATSGDEQWRFDTGTSVFSSPTVADGTVYVGCNDSNLYAVNVANSNTSSEGSRVLLGTLGQNNRYNPAAPAAALTSGDTQRSTPDPTPTPEPADPDRATPTDESTRPPPTTANASVGETQSDSGGTLDQLLPSGSGETTTAILASYVIGFAMVAVMVTFVAYIVYREYGPDELFTHSE